MRLAAYRTDAFVRPRRCGARCSPDRQRDFHVGDVAADIVSRHAASALHLRVLDGGEALYASGQAPAAAGVFRVATPLRSAAAPGSSSSRTAGAFPHAGDALMRGSRSSAASPSACCRRAGRLALHLEHRRAPHRPEITEDLRKSGRAREAQRQDGAAIETLPNPCLQGHRRAATSASTRPGKRLQAAANLDHRAYGARALSPRPEIADRMHGADQSLWPKPGTRRMKPPFRSRTPRSATHLLQGDLQPARRPASLVHRHISTSRAQQAEKRQVMEHAVHARIGERRATPRPPFPRWRASFARRWAGVRRALALDPHRGSSPLPRAGRRTRPRRQRALAAAGRVRRMRQDNPSGLQTRKACSASRSCSEARCSAPWRSPRDERPRRAADGDAAVDRQPARHTCSAGSRGGACASSPRTTRLTGLPNRVMFGQAPRSRHHGRRNPRRRLAVLFIDLDRFQDHQRHARPRVRRPLAARTVAQHGSPRACAQATPSAAAGRRVRRAARRSQRARCHRERGRRA